MEGNERLILLKPDTESRDGLGQQINNFISIKVYARRQDRGGRESVYSDTRAGQWQTRFEIRATPSVISMDETWLLEDSRGQRHNIEGVSYAPIFGGRRFLYIYVVRIQASRL